MEENRIAEDNHKLDETEIELRSFLKSKGTSWIQFYDECERVKRLRLWKGKYSGWTQFINHLANVSGVHVSTIWKKLKAGKTLNEYNNSVSEEDRIDPYKTNITVENIILIDQIIMNTELEDVKKLKNALLQKAASGELSRDELQEARRIVKSIKTKHKIEIEKFGIDKVMENKHANIITTVDIIEAISKNDWLWAHKEYKKFCPSDIQPCYKLFGEFTCGVDLLLNPPRMDAMIIENHTSEISHKTRRDDLSIYLHGVEIITSTSDLHIDAIAARYTQFCNYVYIAVPEELVDYAKKVANSPLGIISVKKEKGRAIAEIVQRPKLNIHPGAISLAYQALIQRSCISK